MKVESFETEWIWIATKPWNRRMSFCNIFKLQNSVFLLNIDKPIRKIILRTSRFDLIVKLKIYWIQTLFWTYYSWIKRALKLSVEHKVWTIKIKTFEEPVWKSDYLTLQKEITFTSNNTEILMNFAKNVL